MGKKRGEIALVIALIGILGLFSVEHLFLFYDMQIPFWRPFPEEYLSLIGNWWSVERYETTPDYWYYKRYGTMPSSKKQLRIQGNRYVEYNEKSSFNIYRDGFIITIKEEKIYLMDSNLNTVVPSMITGRARISRTLVINEMPYEEDGKTYVRVNDILYEK